MSTLYRRPLPADAIAFSSAEGRKIFAEALAQGGLDGYFPLAEQFHTQADPAFCGLGSLVVALNAMGIDPGRLWKGPWRWFAEDLLDCCVPLSVVRERGLSLDELACLASCNGAEASLSRAAPEAASLEVLRSALARAAQGGEVLIAAYDRASLGQTGSGHYSPIGGYHAARDLTLVLDVARFKYPSHWVPVERLWRAMHAYDAATGLPRGWISLRPRTHGVALGFSLRCQSESWQSLRDRFRSVVSQLIAASDVHALARAVLPLADHLEFREPAAPAHRTALETARQALRELPVYTSATECVGLERAEAVSLLLLAMATDLGEAQRALLRRDVAPRPGPLTDELANLCAQLRAVTRFDL